jgi:uncharacterized cupin superfamily protein
VQTFRWRNQATDKRYVVWLQRVSNTDILHLDYPLRVGDFIACPAGGVETAHQIVNTGPEELRFLAVSTKRSPEICEYPHSGKFGVYGEFSEASDGKPTLFRYLGREAQSIDYWEGE